MPFKNAEKRKQYMRKYFREYRARKKQKLKQLFLTHYDWAMDAYVIPRKEVGNIANLT